MSAHSFRLTQLDSGLKVITENMPSIRSAALSFFIGVGSRVENEREAGLSHFLEHLLFKGTSRYGSSEIDHIFDGMGAELNAGTDREATVVYGRMLSQHIPKAFDVMADMVLRPAFREIDTERAVVLEEIAMYEDDPQESIFDLGTRSMFGDHPLGRPVIGTAGVIRDTPVDEIAGFHHSHYRPDSIVIAAAGQVDHDEIVKLAEQALALGYDLGTSTPKPAESVRELQPRLLFQKKATEQCHIYVGGRGLPRGDDRRFAAQVLDAIFGGLTSSRLFQAVREKRGLAYSIYSFLGQYAETGQSGIYLGTRPENLSEALSIVAQEIERLRETPATGPELERVRENVKARVVLALESTGARTSRLGGAVLFGIELMEIDEIMERIDAVTIDELQALACEFWDSEYLSAAGIGPDEDSFHNAVEPICRQAKVAA